MARVRIIEKAIADVRKEYWDKFYTNGRNSTDVTGSKDIAYCVLHLDKSLTDNELSALESALALVSNIADASIIISQEVPVAPEGCNLMACVEGRIKIGAVVETPKE